MRCNRNSLPATHSKRCWAGIGSGDVCGGELYQRSDDTPEAVERRLNIYFEQTEPLLGRWKPRGIVHEIDGNASIDQVAESIMESLRGVLDASTMERVS